MYSMGILRPAGKFLSDLAQKGDEARLSHQTDECTKWEATMGLAGNLTGC